MYNEEYIINPVKLTDNETGRTYELDFNRESVKFAEAKGFEVDLIRRFPQTWVPEFFFLAFRKNHVSMPRTQTDKILKKMDGLTQKLLERLLELYNQAAAAHIIAYEDEAEKNSAVTVEL